MFNRELKRRIERLERRVRILEIPFLLKNGDKVFGYNLYSFYGSLYHSERGNFKVVDTYREDDGFPRYSVYSKKTGVIKDLYFSQIITKKPKKK